MRVCGAWDGRVSGRRGLDFPVIWDRAGGPRWSVARAFLPGGFFKSSSSQVSAAGRFRREIEIRGSRCVIHGRARFLPRALREIGNWVAHKARGPTSVALQSRENELSFLVLDDAKFRALVWHGGVHRSAASFCGLHLLDGVEVARTSSLFGAAGPAICVLFRRITRSTCPRSRPGHRPEVGPPVRLIYGDVAGLRNGGARTPYIIAAMARGRRCSRRPMPHRRNASRSPRRRASIGTSPRPGPGLASANSSCCVTRRRLSQRPATHSRRNYHATQ